jgi:hypothetical protein
VLEAVIWQASATRNSSVVILKGPIFCEWFELKRKTMFRILSVPWLGYNWGCYGRRLLQHWY